MCAISGILQLPYDDACFHGMLASMRRRGPDGEGIFVDKECALLHTRLAIIDPENGAQPMTFRQGKETYIISYNGELYNTDEVRQELIQKGHEFTTRSDTEVLLHAYVQWKEACLDKLNGIFAFVVWETHTRELFLARDRMGVKPLFYMHHNGGLLFASEIKTILAYPGVEARLNFDGAAQILLLGPGRIPGSGVLKDIYEVEPGCWAKWKNGRLEHGRYWYLTDGEHTDSFEETVEKVRFLVTDSIQRQMVSDVPVGTFLSGGLDSSLISAICAREMKKQGKILETFSLDYLDNERYFTPNKFQPNADGEFIRCMQEFIGSSHHWTVLRPEDLVNTLEEATLARDLPGMADVDFSLLAFCGQIRKNVKVALSGECADEIFGGYPWYRDPEVRSTDGFPWSQNADQRVALLHPDIRRNVDGKAFIYEQYTRTINQSDVSATDSPLEKRMKQMVNLNYRWFMQTLLDRKDRMSMYHGLEVRVPFCDYRIAEYLYRIPWEYKDYQGMEKGLLRYAMEGILPEKVLYRKKSPYPKTYHPDYLKRIGELFDAMLHDSNAPIFGMIDGNALRIIPENEPLWPWYGQLMRKPQTMAFMLQINFWLKYYSVSIDF